MLQLNLYIVKLKPNKKDHNNKWEKEAPVFSNSALVQ